MADIAQHDTGAPAAKAKLRVHYFQRRRRPNSNFSLEFIFDDVRARLRDEVDARTIAAPWYSNGLLRRIGIALNAFARQGQINHITGDITFAAIPLRKRQTVVTMLDCGSVLQSSGVKRLLLQKLWVELPIARSAAVTTISEQSKAEIVQLAACDPNKIVVVPVAISDRFTFVPKAFNERCPRILAIGTAPNKNLARLVEALEGLSCTLVIIGQLQDNQRDAIQRTAVNVENYFNLTADDVIEQYQRCDMVAFPSCYEGFGMPILEAQAVGRPVVTSNLSSMPEVAGDAACFVNPLDVTSIREGVRRVIDEPALRSQLVDRGRANVKRFDPQLIALQYLEIYARLAAR